MYKYHKIQNLNPFPLSSGIYWNHLGPLQHPNHPNKLQFDGGECLRRG